MSDLSATPISKLKVAFDNTFGKDNWFDLEVETITMTMDLEFSDLLHDKIYVLKIICGNPKLFYEDLAFTLYSTDVINNKSAEFDSIPSITSLELAYAIVEMNRVVSSLGQAPTYNTSFIKAVTYILRGEGFSKVIPPFQFIPRGALKEGQTDKDSLNKETAIKMYISKMDEGTHK